MTLTGTPIDALQYSDGNDPIATGDDMIKNFLLALDGRLHTPGDLKHSVQTTDHGLWVVADGRNNIVRANVHPNFVTLMLALGYTGSDGTHIGVPDHRGRVLVGLGQHADVNAITDNEGLAVANRRPKHKHTGATSTDGNHSHGFQGESLSNPGGGVIPYFQRNVDLDSTFWSTDAQGSHAHGVSVGPQTGAEPTDGPAYAVGCIFIFAGKP